MYTVFKLLDKIATGLYSYYFWSTTPFTFCLHRLQAFIHADKIATGVHLDYICLHRLQAFIQADYICLHRLQAFIQAFTWLPALTTPIYEDLLFTSALFKKIISSLFTRIQASKPVCEFILSTGVAAHYYARFSSHVRRMTSSYEFWNRIGPWNTITGLWIDTRRRHWNLFTD